MGIRQVEAAFWVGGALFDHPEADAFAREVHRLLHRYATEVVSTYRLCPFLHNVDNGLGAVCVMLEPETRVDEGLAAIQATEASVVHLAYPLLPRSAPVSSEAPKATLTPSSKFERFGNALAEALRRARTETLVHATFHPELVGGTENPHRMVGLLRRSPDPFVQFIPPGMHEGGTVIAGAEPPTVSPLEATFARVVTGGELDELERILAELHRERVERDERFRGVFG